MDGSTGKITFGKELFKLEAGGFVLTETVHSPSLVLPRHDHEFPNINFTIHGSFRETIGRKPQECCASSLLIKPASEAHANEYGDKGAHCLIIEVPSRRLDSSGTLSSFFEEPRYIKNAFLASIAMRVYRELRTPGWPASLLIEGLLLELLAHASRLEPQGPGVSLKWLEDARRFIHDRFSDQISLSTVAEKIGIHPSHLARSFRKQYGCSVGTYIMRLRVEHAARQLHDLGKPLSEIATGAGFYDQSQFTNVFRRHLGITPSRYRLVAHSSNSNPIMHRLSKTH